MKRPRRTCLRAPHTRQDGAVLLVTLLLLVGIVALSTAAVSTGIMEMRMANNAEANSNTFQTALGAIDFSLADPANLPATGPLDVPSDVSLSGTAFAGGGADSLSAQLTRVGDCAAPPRMTNATSMTAYSAFRYEASTEIDKNSSGMGQSGMVQGYLLLGPKC